MFFLIVQSSYSVLDFKTYSNVISSFIVQKFAVGLCLNDCNGVTPPWAPSRVGLRTPGK